jgi:Flp pilus assembly protein TadB
MGVVNHIDSKCNKGVGMSEENKELEETLEKVNETVREINKGSVDTISEVVDKVREASKEVHSDLRKNVILAYVTFVVVTFILLLTVAILAAIAAAVGYHLFILLT